MDTQEQIKQLNERVAKLENEVKAMKSVSTFPLEIENALIGRGFLKVLNEITFYGGVGGNAFPNIYVNYLNNKALISVSLGLREFIVNTSTDICTSVNHGFNGGEYVLLYSTDTLPAGLDTPSAYQVLYLSANTFKLSLDGVNPVNITTAGVGTHYIDYLT